MKIRLDFVTNSSSTCYVLDKRTLTDEELELIERNWFLHKPIYFGVGRGSTYGEGEAVQEFLDWLKLEDADWVATHDESWANSQTAWLQEHLAQIGVDNIIFVRSSDEGMGGSVVHSRLIAEKAIGRREYH